MEYIIFILLAIFLFFALLLIFLKNGSKTSEINNHKYDYYVPDLEPFNLSEDIYYTFKGSYRTSDIFAKGNKQEPIKFTIYRDETGNPHFAITYTESGEYEVGEMNNVTYDYSDPKIYQLKFDWLSYNSNGELGNSDVLFQRYSKPKRTVIRCLIGKQFKFKGKTSVTQDYVDGVQLSKEYK